MQDANMSAGQMVSANNPAIGNCPYMPAAPLAVQPWTVPSAVPMARVARAPAFADVGLRPPMIGFDFRKRQYIGI